MLDSFDRAVGLVLEKALGTTLCTKGRTTSSVMCLKMEIITDELQPPVGSGQGLVRCDWMGAWLGLMPLNDMWQCFAGDSCA